MGRPKINTPEILKQKKAAFYQANKAAILAKCQQWAEANRSKSNALKAKWRAKNPDYQKRYEQENRQSVNAHKSAYEQRNKEKVAKAKEKWRLNNREYMREYLAKHPQKFREASLRRRGLKKENSTPEQIKASKQSILKMLAQKYTVCAYCDDLFLTGLMHVDHILPLEYRGPHAPENLTMACKDCNLSKGHRLLWIEWTPPNEIQN